MYCTCGCIQALLARTVTRPLPLFSQRNFRAQKLSNRAIGEHEVTGCVLHRVLWIAISPRNCATEAPKPVSAWNWCIWSWRRLQKRLKLWPPCESFTR
jgi:hypothetical protein